MMEQNLINEQVTGFEDEQDKIDSESSSSMSSANDDEEIIFSTGGNDGFTTLSVRACYVIDIDIENACDDSGEESSEEEDERRLENLEW